MEPRPLEVSLGRDGTVLITIQGDLRKEESLSMLKQDIVKGNTFIREESQRALRPLSTLVDLTKLSNAYEPEGMLLLAEFEKNNRPYVHKTACFTEDAKLRLAGEIISALSNRKNIFFFKTREEALASLRAPE